MIKNWLDSINIVYSEGPMCLNWANILGHIRGDFEGFVNDGGWAFILDQNQEDNQEGSEEENSDSEYNED